MILLNFTHPLNQAQCMQIETLVGHPLGRMEEHMGHFDVHQDFAPQIVALVDAVDLTPLAWQTHPILVHLPGFAPAAACLLAELHGRMGHFPAILRLRPAPHPELTRYEVAEIVNLQALRDRARTWRATKR